MFSSVELEIGCDQYNVMLNETGAFTICEDVCFSGSEHTIK